MAGVGFVVVVLVSDRLILGKEGIPFGPSGCEFGLGLALFCFGQLAQGIALGQAFFQVLQLFGSGGCGRGYLLAIKANIAQFSPILPIVAHQPVGEMK